MSLFSKYNSLLLRRPFLTNALTTGFLFGSGDYLAQNITNYNSTKKLDYDYARTLRAIIYGSVVFAPLGDRWYKLLAKIKAPGIKNPSLMANTITRVSADQLGFAPFLGIPLYYSCMTFMEDFKADNKFEIIKKALDKNWWPTLKTNWLVWPAFQLVNFYLVPVQMRLLVVNVISVGWNCYLSLALNDKSGSAIIDEQVDSEDRIMI